MNQNLNMYICCDMVRRELQNTHARRCKLKDTCIQDSALHEIPIRSNITMSRTHTYPHEFVPPNAALPSHIELINHSGQLLLL